MKTMIACTASALAGIVLVLACSDDAPGSADAAPVCDCPAAEPPLADRIVTLESAPADLPANQLGGTGLSCAAGSKLLSGSCRMVTTVRNVTLVDAFRDPLGVETWQCDWDNRTAEIHQVIASVTCLLPPE